MKESIQIRIDTLQQQIETILDELENIDHTHYNKYNVLKRDLAMAQSEFDLLVESRNRLDLN